MRSQLRHKAVEVALVATVVGSTALAGVRVADNNILIVPGQNTEAEQKILVIPGQAHGGSGSGGAQLSHDTAGGHAAKAPAPARKAAKPPSANRQEQLDKSRTRETGTERGNGLGTRY